MALAKPRNSRNRLPCPQRRGKLRLSRVVGVLLFSVSSLLLWMLSLHHKIHAVSTASLDSNSRHEVSASQHVPESTNGTTTTLAASTEDSSEGGMAACLLVMDDNFFLIEWLAYHYHTLPLRYLVIAVDPRSKTSPLPVLDRWRSRQQRQLRHNNNNKLNLTIVAWTNDRDYMSQSEQDEAQSYVSHYFGSGIGETVIQHRARQRMFYYKCLVHLKERGRDWALLTDSDEFLRIHYEHPTFQEQKDYALPISQPGSVLSFLRSELQQQQQHDRAHNTNWTTSPCIQIPRIRFGGAESSSTEIQQDVPQAFQRLASNFLTFRWRFHANPSDYGHNRISKVLLDLSRVPLDAIQPVDSIHRPIKSLCGQRKLHIRKDDQVLLIHHYLGTQEQYMFRDDARKGKERSITQYQKAKQIHSQTDDHIRPWLQGFVDHLGLKAASKLLKDVGVVKKT